MHDCLVGHPTVAQGVGQPFACGTSSSTTSVQWDVFFWGPLLVYPSCLLHTLASKLLALSVLVPVPVMPLTFFPTWLISVFQGHALQGTTPWFLHPQRLALHAPSLAQHPPADWEWLVFPVCLAPGPGAPEGQRPHCAPAKNTPWHTKPHRNICKLN